MPATPSTRDDPRLLVRVTPEVLRPEEALAFAGDPRAGGICVFLGTVRDHSDAGEVDGLTYEAWDELARTRLQEIGGEILASWPATKVALLHRVGALNVGEISVVVACSAPHRDEAFEACRHGIERLKQDVPIWKKEGLVSGDAHWVMGS